MLSPLLHLCFPVSVAPPAMVKLAKTFFYFIFFLLDILPTCPPFKRYIFNLFIVLCPYFSIYQPGEQLYIFSAFSRMKINKTYNFPCSIVSKVTDSKVTRSESDSGRLTRKRTGGPQSVRYIYTTSMNGYVALDTELYCI